MISKSEFEAALLRALGAETRADDLIMSSEQYGRALLANVAQTAPRPNRRTRRTAAAIARRNALRMQRAVQAYEGRYP